MNVLAIDIGGSSIKILVTAQDESRKFPSGPTMTPKRMVAGVKKLARDWKYDAVSIGYPGLVVRNRPLAEPYNLGRGWAGFDLEPRSSTPSRSSMMRPCKLWEATSAARCCSSGWELVSVPP